MAKALYLDNMRQTNFEAEVISVKENKYIILNQTIFYPKSGGVDCDTGKLTRISDNKIFNVVFAGKFKGEISHEVDSEGLHEGDKIKGEIDWNRRFELMRYHTAAHVLSGLFFQYDNVKVTGNEMRLGQGRIDFSFPDFDREKIDELVTKANEIIAQDLKIETYHITREELDSDPSLMKLAMSLPDSIQNIRIVDIKGFDKQPDGGCHVSHLNEIGNVEIVKIQNKGKNNRRLYFRLV